MQFAALCPPQNILVMQISFAMTDIPTTDHRAQPEAMHHLLCRDIAPGTLDVAFITTLIDHHRLLISATPLAHTLQVGMLDAGVCHPRLVVVIEGTAVVNRAQMLIGVTFLHHAEEAIPIA